MPGYPVSAALTSLVRADGLLVVPAGLEGHHPGTDVEVHLLRGLADIDRTIVPGAALSELAVVRLVHREQGLIVAAGNPLEITGIEDLRRPGLRYVNRQRGAGTRVLLDHELRRRYIAPTDVTGYHREEYPHLAVAAAVAAGRADAGLGVLAAARPFGLDFVPVAQEPYDLVLTQQAYDSEVLAPLWALLAQPTFHTSIEALGGYSSTETGRQVR